MALPSDLEVITGRIARRWQERALAVAASAFGALLVATPAQDLGGPLASYVAIEGVRLAWGLWLFGLGLVRLVVLIINGWWPVSPWARLALSLATVVTLWFPLSLGSALAAVREIFNNGGEVTAGVMLGPMVLWTEGICMLQLRAWVENLKLARGGRDRG